MSQSPSPIAPYPHPSHVRLIRAPVGPRPISSASSRSSLSRSSSGRSITNPVLPTIPDREEGFLQLPTVNEARSGQRSSHLSDVTSCISHTTFSTVPTPGFDFLESQFDALLQQLNGPAAEAPGETSEPLARSPSITPSVTSTSAKSAIAAAAAARLEARKSQSTFGPPKTRRSPSSSTATTGRASVRSRAASIQTKPLLSVYAPASPTALLHTAPRSTVVAAPPPVATAQHHRIDSGSTVASDMTLAEEIDSSFFKTDALSAEVASLAKEYSGWKSITQPLSPTPSPPPSALVSASSPNIPLFSRTPEMGYIMSYAPHYDEKTQSSRSNSLRFDDKASLRLQSDLEAQKFPMRGVVFEDQVKRDRPATIVCLHLIKVIFASVAFAILALCIYAIVRRTKG